VGWGRCHARRDAVAKLEDALRVDPDDSRAAAGLSACEATLEEGAARRRAEEAAQQAQRQPPRAAGGGGGGSSRAAGVREQQQGGNRPFTRRTF